MKDHVKKYFVFFLLLSISLMFASCYSSRLRDYYNDESNYVNASGVVIHIACNSEEPAIYYGFSDLSRSFDDICFKIVGENFRLVRERGIDRLIAIGDKVEFTTAPRYFGDGYVMPIVSISVDGNTLLEYDEGLANFLEWLENR